MELSVIYPMHDEEGNVDELLERTYRTLIEYYKAPNKFEILCIDDHSTDNTAQRVNEWSKKYPNIKYIRLEKGRGHAKAIEKGFSSFSQSSKYVFLSDSDLQYSPEEIVDFLEYARGHPGVKIINGWRKDKRYEGLIKRISSRIFNKLSQILFKTEINDNASNFTLYDAKIVRDLELSGNDQRYIISILKFKFGLSNENIHEIPISHNPRIYGSSKYPAWKKVLFGFFEIIKKWRELKKKYPQKR